MQGLGKVEDSLLLEISNIWLDSSWWGGGINTWSIPEVQGGLATPWTPCQPYKSSMICIVFVSANHTILIEQKPYHTAVSDFIQLGR